MGCKMKLIFLGFFIIVNGLARKPMGWPEKKWALFGRAIRCPNQICVGPEPAQFNMGQWSARSILIPIARLILMGKDNGDDPVWWRLFARAIRQSIHTTRKIREWGSV